MASQSTNYNQISPGSLRCLFVPLMILSCAATKCNYNKQQCKDRSANRTREWEKDCYIDDSSAFGITYIESCVQPCHPHTGMPQKCTDFCEDFEFVGECTDDSALVSTTTINTKSTAADVTKQQDEADCKSGAEIYALFGISLMCNLIVLIIYLKDKCQQQLPACGQQRQRRTEQPEVNMENGVTDVESLPMTDLVQTSGNMSHAESGISSMGSQRLLDDTVVSLSAV